MSFKSKVLVLHVLCIYVRFYDAEKENVSLTAFQIQE